MCEPLHTKKESIILNSIYIHPSKHKIIGVTWYRHFPRAVLHRDCTHTIHVAKHDSPCLFLSPPWKDALEEATIKLKDVHFFVEYQSKGSGTTNKHSWESPWSYDIRENMTCPPALLIWAQEFQTYSLFFPIKFFSISSSQHVLPLPTEQST